MINFSSTDYVGHRFGANSKEIQDTYIRLDKEIERLLMYLDEEIGKREYTVFLEFLSITEETLQGLKVIKGFVSLH